MYCGSIKLKSEVTIQNTAKVVLLFCLILLLSFFWKTVP